MVVDDSDTMEDMINYAMGYVGVDRQVAYQLARIKLEYDKPNHGKWENNT